MQSAAHPKAPEWDPRQSNIPNPVLVITIHRTNSPPLTHLPKSKISIPNILTFMVFHLWRNLVALRRIIPIHRSIHCTNSLHQLFTNCMATAPPSRIRKMRTVVTTGRGKCRSHHRQKVASFRIRTKVLHRRVSAATNAHGIDWKIIYCKSCWILIMIALGNIVWVFEVLSECRKYGNPNF